ncbi:hypothetical protein M3231_15260 [Neobacillus mesonae]|nr:hypothetical protein [Neobacillus mesonae]
MADDIIPYLPRWADKNKVDSHTYVFHPLGDGFAACLKAREDGAEINRIYPMDYVDTLEDVYLLVKPEIPEGPSAEIVPFPIRKTPDQLRQDAVIELLEPYAEMAREGAITGVIIAAKTEAGVIDGDIHADYSGVSYRERVVMLGQLTEMHEYEI